MAESGTGGGSAAVDSSRSTVLEEEVQKLKGRIKFLDKQNADFRQRLEASAAGTGATSPESGDTSPGKVDKVERHASVRLDSVAEAEVADWITKMTGMYQQEDLAEWLHDGAALLPSCNSLLPPSTHEAMSRHLSLICCSFGPGTVLCHLANVIEEGIIPRVSSHQLVKLWVYISRALCLSIPVRPAVAGQQTGPLEALQTSRKRVELSQGLP